MITRAPTENSDESLLSDILDDIMSNSSGVQEDAQQKKSNVQILILTKTSLRKTNARSGFGCIGFRDPKLVIQKIRILFSILNAYSASYETIAEAVEDSLYKS
jgi:hypothetical protein